jgi:putative tryptophan/tyrosine transport system substrate-binding protein
MLPRWQGDQMQFDQLKRRELITLLGGAAAWPFAPRAQNAARTARIGYLNSIRSPSVEAALVEGLRDLGWIEGKNLFIERRVCSGDAECLVKSAVELTELKVEVIVAEATASTQAAKAATSSVPIVFAATGDPVGQGFVASLAPRR